MGAERTCLFVLGAHRSRTSAVTRTANLLGAAIGGELIGPARTNRTGHWENARVVQLNDAILSSQDAAWDDWRALPLQDAHSVDRAAFLGMARDALAEVMGEASLAVIKDPRLCVTGAVWLQAAADLGVTPKALLTVRHPLAVARSLQRRDQSGLIRGMMIWLRHVLEAERFSRAIPRCFIDTHRLLTDWKGVMGRAGETLNIAWPAWNSVDRQVEHFLQQASGARDDRAAAETSDMPAVIQEAWAELATMLAEGETAQGRETFDRIRLSLDGPFAILERFLGEEQESWRKIASRRGRRALAEARREITELRLSNWSLAVSRDRQIITLDGRLDEALHAHAECARELDRQRRLNERLQVRLAALDRPSHWRRARGPEAAATHADVQRIALSGLFDEPWYLQTSPLATASGLDPVEHYLAEGAQMGSAPNPLFDAAWYVSMNGLGDLPLERALLHFLDQGETAGLSPHWLFDPVHAGHGAGTDRPLEGLLAAHLSGRGLGSPHPCFDPRWYLEVNPDVAASRADPFIHFVTHGFAEGRAPMRDLQSHHLAVLSRSALFDIPAYRKRFPPPAFTCLSPAAHFVFWGAPQGLDPHPLFDTAWYRRQHPDAGVNPLIHFLQRGWRQGRSPHPAFDVRWYLAQNPDVAASGENPAEHFLRYGWMEGRSPHPSISGGFHAQTAGLNPDLSHFLRDRSERIGLSQ